MDDKFCIEDGVALVEVKEVYTKKEIIKILRNKDNETSHFIDTNGNSNNEGSNTTVVLNNIVLYSKLFPNTLFEVLMKWDRGFGDLPDKYFIQNGKKQHCDSELIFEKYDLTKMK
jgi:hypothetical protein